MTDAHKLRTMSYEVSEELAPTWEARRGFIEEVAAPVREWMIRELAPQPGDTVLELAAGVGDTGFALAPIIGSDGRLVSTDFSPAMLEAARRRGSQLGIENVDYEVIDAESIEFDDDSVDGVLCRFGYMLMADSGAALAETRRVLRPGGRLTLAVWAAPEHNPFFAITAMTLVQHGHLPPPEPPPAPGLFSMASPKRTRSLLESAGFTEARTEQIPLHFEFDDFDDYLGTIQDTAGPVAMALRGLDAAEREAIASRIEEALAPFASSRGFEMPGAALAAVAS